MTLFFYQDEQSELWMFFFQWTQTYRKFSSGIMFFAYFFLMFTSVVSEPYKQACPWSIYRLEISLPRVNKRYAGQWFKVIQTRLCVSKFLIGQILICGFLVKKATKKKKKNILENYRNQQRNQPLSDSLDRIVLINIEQHSPMQVPPKKDNNCRARPM